MSLESGLVSKIPFPSQNWQTKTNVPPVASVKVSNVEDKGRQNIESLQDKSNGLFEKIKAYFVAKRIKQLENIPEDKRTPAQKAEIEANKKSADYMV